MHSYHQAFFKLALGPNKMIKSAKKTIQIYKKYFNYPKILILVDFFLNKLLISGIKIIMNFFKEIMFTMKLKLKLVNPCKEYAK